MREAVARRRIQVRGTVQGVGFRPFVHRLAARHGLTGWVLNHAGGVEIEVEGPARTLDLFMAGLRGEAPPLARIEALGVEDRPPSGAGTFEIRLTRAEAGESQPVPPDTAVCADCLRELFDPADRRYRYPFINCTNCGPRFTVIEAMPYDRPRTTMRRFPLCGLCRREYENPSDRRFHAQPNACPACGPRLWFANRIGIEQPGEAIGLAAAALRDGAILAIKGLGGFQLCCDAGDEHVVRRLRERKHRPSKPFAIMLPDLSAVQALCRVSEHEAAILTGTARPVVLLRRRDPGAGAGVSPAVSPTVSPAVAPAVAPGLHELGVMLPYTPVHHLLLQAMDCPLVMTSGNLTEEPIARDNHEALHRLGPLADGFLFHDRDIAARYDDSVVRVMAGDERLVRRARGYCPAPMPIAGAYGDVLAFGGHLKNTFCILKDGRAYVGPHIGDLDEPLAFAHQQEALTTYLRLFESEPRLLACDSHPDYASTRLAETWGDGSPDLVRVQHHHAHIASVMAEHGLRGGLIGVAFDGTGYGTDGTVWGGEFLVSDERSFVRAGHLEPVRLPGGDRCAREGWRMACAYLLAAGLGSEQLPGWLQDGEGAPDEQRWRLVTRLAASPTAAPLTTSAGRLFDAVASLLGVGHCSTFEAEAAMRLEGVASAVDIGAVEPWPVAMAGTPLRLDTPGLVKHLVRERCAGRPVAELAAAFHASLALAIVEACERLRSVYGLGRVALSGGVFQNGRLLERAMRLLVERDFAVYVNRSVPANDGGISLGQALVAAARSARGGERYVR
jgi:hydrogenase maturation protein HypF